MHNHPTKVKVLELQSTNVLICCAHTNEQTLISANDLVRRIDNGTYEVENFIEPPVQFDLFAQEQDCWLAEQLVLPELQDCKKPLRLYELEEMMA